MRKIVKKYIKPALNKVGIYQGLYELYFYLLDLNVKIRNAFLKKFCKTAPILLYHRIAKVSNDPVMLCVSPENFEKHIIFLKEKYKIIPLLELSNKITNKTLEGDELAITFDDGYKDNLTNALPILEKYNIPATIFVTTSQIGEKASFEWDYGYSEKDRATFLSQDEIKKLSENRLIDIGAHTHTHPRLSDLNENIQIEEITKSKDILEQITGKKIKLLAYPFGGKFDINDDTVKAISETDLLYAFTNNGSMSSIKNKRFLIPRINIRNDTKFVF